MDPYTLSFSVITATYNRLDLTQKFISSLAPYVIGNNGELIIVDYASKDQTASFLSKQARLLFPGLRLRVVLETENRGMGTALNTGVKISKGNVLLMISNDVMIEGDPIRDVVKYFAFDKSPAGSLLGPRLITFNTGWNSFKEVEVIPYLEGWFVASTRAVWNRLRGWDERIFLDYEDMELSWRAHQIGIGLAQINLPVMHIGGQSFQTQEITRYNFTKTSQAYFCNKWGLTLKE